MVDKQQPEAIGKWKSTYLQVQSYVFVCFHQVINRRE